MKRPTFPAASIGRPLSGGLIRHDLPPAPYMTTSELNQINCPQCNESILATAVACPNCGRQNFVEHPGDMQRVKHAPTDLPPADESAYGPGTDRPANPAG